MDMNSKIIIVDLDGTLANVNHRRDYVMLSDTRKKKDWKSFNASMHLDPVNRWCLDILNKYSKDPSTLIYIVSGRDGAYENITREWLSNNRVPFDALYMRPVKNNDDDTVVKKDIYEKHLKDKDILFVLDDRLRVVKMWRSLGLTVLQCDEGDY